MPTREKDLRKQPNMARPHSGNASEIQKQCDYGAQSKRGKASQHQLAVLENNTHAQDCFAQLANREQELCGE